MKEDKDMVDIRHKVGVETTSPHDVYAALTTIDGLSGWWTNETAGDAAKGGVVKFRFGGKGGCDVAVLEAVPNERVLWQVVDGPSEWIDTKVAFDLEQVDGYTKVMFTHADWREPGEFMHHCSTKWATFLLSLKAMVETGSGTPSPHDVRIDDWD
jgi:uncharacterized protein YndB with AHSA1/START domain